MIIYDNSTTGLSQSLDIFMKINLSVIGDNLCSEECVQGNYICGPFVNDPKRNDYLSNILHAI